MGEHEGDIYESEFCVVGVYTPAPGRGTIWYIGHADESYNSPDWPTREAMIADLEAALVALRGDASHATLDA